MSDDLEQRVRERINDVPDACSLSQAIPIGLTDMGLVTGVRTSSTDEEGRRDVHVVLRVTAPGCMHVPFMDRAIRTAISDLEDVREVSTEWEPTADWTPRDIAEPIRLRMAEARARRLREHLAAAG